MKIAAYTGTRNLYDNMEIAVKSLLINSDVDKVYLLIEDDEFPHYLPKEVEIINVSNQTYFRQDGPNMNSRFTYMAMMRATYSYLFPQYDRILSLDVDTIVDKDISDIWNLPIENYYFSASKEPQRTRDEKIEIYTNIGVALYNLDKLREDGKVDEVVQELNRRRYTFLEQDVFNYLCQGHILNMPSCYNACDWTIPTYDRRIVHYAGIKDWMNEPHVLKYKFIEWDRIIR